MSKVPGHYQSPFLDDILKPIEPEKSSTNLYDKVKDNLSANPIFSGGAALGAIGIGITLFKRFGIAANTRLRRHLVRSLEITNENPAYPWVMSHINTHSKIKANNVLVDSQLNFSESGHVRMDHYFTPGTGIHYFNYNGRFVKMERNREKSLIHKDGVRKPFETVTLTTYGFFGRSKPTEFWQQFLARATQEGLETLKTGLVIYQAIGPEWKRLGNPRKKRPLESVILEGDTLVNLFNDIVEFLASELWYTDRGIPYRRGYLCYGPPGTGKSSFISALAGRLGYSICMLSLSERTLDDLRLNHLMSNMPPKSFLLLEDIDAAFAPRDQESPAQQKMYEGITLSGLLNALDGVASSEERLIFMTTNYRDRLDSALIRPGRVDVQQHFGYCTPQMLKILFMRFYYPKKMEAPDPKQALIEKQMELNELAEKFSTAVLSVREKVSPAQIQKHLINYKDDPQKAIENIKEIE